MTVCPICNKPIYANQKRIFQYHESCLKKEIKDGQVIYYLPTGGKIVIKLSRAERRRLGIKILK